MPLDLLMVNAYFSPNSYLSRSVSAHISLPHIFCNGVTPKALWPSKISKPTPFLSPSILIPISLLAIGPLPRNCNALLHKH